jgi:predicted MarR family transcription regulator
MTSGQITYDLRRLRAHGMIERIPRTHRYTITADGIRTALFLTRLSQRFLIPGMAHATGPSPPADSTLRTASRAYEAAINDLARDAGLAA